MKDSQKVDAVKCACGKLFTEDSKDYVRVSGNVYVGKDGGLIGNNLNAKKKVVRDSIYCFDCFVNCFPEEIRSRLLFPIISNKNF